MRAGVYDYDSTSILTSEEPLPLQHADLLPGMTAPPMATSQYYTSGRMCEVTQWNELYHNAYDTEVLRLASMFSPMSQMGVVSHASCICGSLWSARYHRLLSSLYMLLTRAFGVMGMPHLD